MRAALRRWGIGLGVALLVLTTGACDKKDDDVSLGTAVRGTVTEVVEASGVVTARTAATVSAPAAGTLGQLRVGAGDRVARGQIIAVIDAPELRARRDAAKKALDAARDQPAPGGGDAGFAAARRRTDRQAAQAFQQARAAAAKITDPVVRDALVKQVDVAEQQYGAASATAGAMVRSLQNGVASLGQAVGALASAQRVQARQAYDLADAAVRALTLRAPVAGVVQLGGTAAAPAPSLTDLLGARPAQAPRAGVDDAVPQGAYVAAGTPIATVVDADRPGLAADVDETDILLVRPGVAASVELDAVPGARYAAAVRAVDLLPTTSARGGVSYKVRLVLAAGDQPAPRPGMSAVVRLRVREAKDAVTVPASAVVNADGKDTLWVVREGKYRREQVTLGVQGEDVVQVLAGVGEGQRIVVAGADGLHSGDPAP